MPFKNPLVVRNSLLLFFSLLFSDHRIIERPGLKGTTVMVSFQPPSCVQGRQPPDSDQADQSHIRELYLDIAEVF